MSDDPYRKKMMGLNLTQAALGVVIATGTILGVFAAYITLPATVHEVQSSQTNLWQQVGKIQGDRQEDHDLMIRMDERLKAVQSAVTEIKADVAELKAASKERRAAQPTAPEESSR